MIEIHVLEALAAFNEYGTLSTAAQHLHISQPALSRAMQKLEQELGVTLFDRTKNRITLNSTGRLAAVYAGKILQDEEEMIRSIRSYDASLHTISVGYCTPSPRMEIPDILSVIYPDAVISSDLKEPDVLITGLRQKKYTMIIVNRPVQDEALTCIPYGSEHLYFSVVPAHPAAVYAEQGLHFKDMDGETFVLANQIGEWDHITKEMMPHANLIYQNDLDALNTIINSSSLPGFATDITIRLFRSEQNRSRIFIPILDPQAKMQYYCVFLKENTEKLEKWIRYIRKA
ncbi:MAG: LysR family transcriptional regulator [Bulleidia sp.]